MAGISVVLDEFDETQIPSEARPSTFRSDAAYVWSVLAADITKINLFRTQANALKEDINATETAISNLKKNIENTAADVVIKKSEIDSKHYDVMNRVIPTESRYSDDIVDRKIRMSQILNLIGA